jgi:hypothetical protein
MKMNHERHEEARKSEDDAACFEAAVFDIEADTQLRETEIVEHWRDFKLSDGVDDFCIAPTPECCTLCCRRWRMELCSMWRGALPLCLTL